MANSIAGRKKREAGKRIGDGIKEDRMPLCSDISPSLLGPLVVDQSPTTMDEVDFGRYHCNPHQSSYCCRWRRSLPGLAMEVDGLLAAAGRLRLLPLSYHLGDSSCEVIKF